ncbi:MAG: hypothetical protein ACYC8T_15655 [Myxococcaceae bacterium]
MLCALLLSAILGGTGPTGPAPWAAPWDGQSFRGYVDGAAGIAFEVPLSGFHLEARHSEAGLPVEKAKHLFTLSGPNGPEVTVDVWVDPERRELGRFFESFLSFLRDEETSIASVVVSRQRVAGMLLSQPRSGQSFGQKAAVFAVDGRVFRITCLNKDDPRALKVFERVVQTFDAEARR